MATCNARIHNTGGWGMRDCSRKAVAGAYCKQHSPEETAKRDQIEAAKYNTETLRLEARRETATYAAAAATYCQAKGLTLEQLKEASPCK